MSLIVWIIGYKKHQFLSTQLEAHCYICLCDAHLKMHTHEGNCKPAVSLRTVGGQVPSVIAGIPSHHICQSLKRGCTRRAFLASTRRYRCIIEGKRNLKDRWIFSPFKCVVIISAAHFSLINFSLSLSPLFLASYSSHSPTFSILCLMS